MAQLMPLPLTVSCFSKIQADFTFLVPAHLGSPGQRAIKRVCVCACCATYSCLKATTVSYICSRVVRQRQMIVEVSEMSRERQQVVGTRPVLQPQVRRSLQSVLELVPEPRGRHVDPRDAVHGRRAAAPRQRRRPPDVSAEPRPRPTHQHLKYQSASDNI